MTVLHGLLRHMCDFLRESIKFAYNDKGGICGYNFLILYFTTVSVVDTIDDMQRLFKLKPDSSKYVWHTKWLTIA